jgi:hypothetical protein
MFRYVAYRVYIKVTRSWYEHPEFDAVENDLDVVRDRPYALLLGIGCDMPFDRTIQLC